MALGLVGGVGIAHAALRTSGGVAKRQRAVGRPTTIIIF